MRKMLYQSPIFGQEEKDAVMRVLDRGWLSNGPETIAFEQEFAKWWEVKYAVSVSSGSTADIVALQALNLPRGSEVITTSGAAFPSTVTAMIYVGLKPVFVDVKGICIDPDEVEKAISPKTKALMFAHTLGFTPDMDKIMKIVNKYKLKLVEDCCDAVGTQYRGQRVGTFGDSATVSFFPAHHMTTGEGGMIITNSKTVYREALMIRDWGRECVCPFNATEPVCGNRYKNPPFDHRYYYTRIGSNFKMTEMQAAFGREQIKRLKGFIQKRRFNYQILCSMLGIEREYSISPFAFPLFSKNKMAEIKFLNENGISTRMLFGGNLLRHPAFKNIDCRIIGDLKESDKVFNEAYFVGIGPHLTQEDIVYIGEKICEARNIKPEVGVFYKR